MGWDHHERIPAGCVLVRQRGMALFGSAEVEVHHPLVESLYTAGRPLPLGGCETRHPVAAIAGWRVVCVMVEDVPSRTFLLVAPPETKS